MFRQGHHNSGRLLAIRSAPNEVGTTRFGYSISRRVGKAVVRNKVRRRLREIVRSLPLAESFDVVITARPAAAAADFHSLKSEAEQLFRRGRLLEGPA